jgi:glycolate oxidase iron-sulfur subunit
MPLPQGSDIRASITALADRCVLCGLCLPQCPTYATDRLEGRSPRGRIALMRRLADEPSGATPALAADLGSCLSCGRCETACPSQVPYGRLLPLARASLRAQRGESLASRALRALARRPRLLQWLMRIARPLARVVPADASRGGWRALLAVLRTVRVSPTALQGTRCSAASPRGRVLLLTGCVASVVERDTHVAAAELLKQEGYAVVIQPDGLCCGSLARQAGALDEADRDAAALRRAVLGMPRVDAVVACASGCLATQRQALAGPGAPALHELMAFLAMHRNLTPAASGIAATRRVALMVPCTQRALDGGRAARAALESIPGLSVCELDDAPGCCGAGAIQFVTDPATSSALRQRRIEQIAASGASLVATTNTGCRLQLQLGLAEAGLDLPVAHPAAIMAAASRDHGA